VLAATNVCDSIEVRYNLMYQHASDWHNNTGVICDAHARGMGIVLMRPLTSGVFQRLMADAFPEIDVLDIGRLLLNYVLSDPYVDVALVGVREARCAKRP
jgi:predicted aldo/keto reductase-like oxidoreductase